MRRKAATTRFIAFTVMAVLLIPSASSSFEQKGRGDSERQSPETADRAEASFQSALHSFDKQESEPARAQFKEAMRLWVGMREPGRAARAAVQMGDHARQARKYQDALGYYQQALTVTSIPGAILANVWYAIAVTYHELYLHDLAVRYFNQSLDQARTSKDIQAQTLAWTGLAESYHQQGVIEKASACIAEALRLSNKDQAAADPALLYLKGEVSQKRGLVKEAKGAFEEALAIYRRTDDVEGQIKVLCALSALSLAASQNQAALDQSEQASDLAKKQMASATNQADFINARRGVWQAGLSRARAERALGQKERALDSYRWAVHQITAMWWTIYIATEASAVAFREEAQATYREYVDLLIEKGELKKAYDTADDAKARALLIFAGARRANPRAEDIKQEAARREASQSVIGLRLKLLAPGLSREQQAELQKEIAAAESQMWEAQIQAEIDHYKERLVWSKPATAEQIRKKMAQDQMTLAEFSLGENRSFLWLFGRGEVSVEVLPSRKEIERAVRAYLNVLAAAPSPLFIERDVKGARGQAETLFAMLFGSLSKQIEPGQRLIVVPDGLLHYLPFEALVHNGHYLVEDHEISYNPSASLLGLGQDSKPQSDERGKMELLAIGNPILGSEVKTPGGKKTTDGLSHLAQQLLAARGFRLSPLSRAQDEVQYIAGLFPTDRRKVLLGKACTEEAIKRESLRPYRRLHIASHSLIDEKSPWRSAVVLTPGDDAEEDGLLDVSEIARLELDADLVVVSACQTGRGQLLSGEGIVGLSRAFLYAGARSVVVSLWDVSDISTGQLMKSFYQYLTGGMTNAAALRQAKLQMLRSGKESRHPHYWSSFVMTGKP
ncbi:MAG TPA: CHAT domain-containing tetratricopeptide repeat protein [Blastocatellia bacterium]|nr:CHAT domain-containing tetratricopeptide repeat protein [Blastocatellia bacterium]